MHPTALNDELLQGNTCFGCGPDNPEGLRIKIYRDGDRQDRLVGVFRPRPTATGFPNVVHGGAQFTALDCMAGWVVFALRNPGRMVPLTATASMRYVKAALLGEELKLSAEITREAKGPREPLGIRTQIRNGAGELLSEADFEYRIEAVRSVAHKDHVAPCGQCPSGAFGNVSRETGSGHRQIVAEYGAAEP